MAALPVVPLVKIWMPSITEKIQPMRMNAVMSSTTPRKIRP